MISAARLTLPFITGAYYGGMPICPLMFLTNLIIRAAPTGTHDSMNYWRMRFRTCGASAPGMVVWETNTNGVPSGMGVIYEQAFAFAFGALEQELYFDTATSARQRICMSRLVAPID